MLPYPWLTWPYSLQLIAVLLAAGLAGLASAKPGAEAEAKSKAKTEAKADAEADAEAAAAADGDAAAAARDPHHSPHFVPLQPYEEYAQPSPYYQPPYSPYAYGPYAHPPPSPYSPTPYGYSQPAEKCTTKEWSSQTELCKPKIRQACENLDVRVKKVLDPKEMCRPHMIPKCKLDRDVKEMRMCNSKVINRRATLHATLYEQQMVVRCNTHYETKCKHSYDHYVPRCYTTPVKVSLK